MFSGPMRARPGYALVATLVVLLFVGACVTVGFYNAPAARGDDAATPAEVAATAAAQAGADAVLRNWDVAMLSRLPARGDTTLVGRAARSDALSADYVVSVGRSGPAQFTITATGFAVGDDHTTYCTIVVRTHLKSGRLAERGAAVSRTCRADA
jgi:hypothetical protein